MATITVSDVRPSVLPPAAGHAGLRGVIASEITKLRSVRSTYWTLAALLIISIGVGVAVMAGESSSLTNNVGNKAGFDGTQVSLIPFFEIGQLIIAVLGAMVITSEYSTGMIRTSLTAMPRRGTVYAAKAIVFTSVTLVISLITSFIAFFAGQAILSGQHLQIAFSQAGVAGAVIGAAGYLTLTGLLAMGLGAILRSTAGGIATFAGVMFVIPPLVEILPSSVANSIAPYLPSNAGDAMMQIGHHANSLSPGAGLAVLAGYVALVIAAAAMLLVKRDV